MHPCWIKAQDGGCAAARAVVKFSCTSARAQAGQQGEPAAAAPDQQQHAVVREVVSSEVAGLLGGCGSAAAYNEAFLEARGTASLRHRAAAARMAALLAPGERARAVHIVMGRGGLLGEGQTWHQPDLLRLCTRP